MGDKKKGKSKRSMDKARKSKAVDRQSRFDHQKRKSQYTPKVETNKEAFYGSSKAPTGKGTKKK